MAAGQAHGAQWSRYAHVSIFLELEGMYSVWLQKCPEFVEKPQL